MIFSPAQSHLNGICVLQHIRYGAANLVVEIDISQLIRDHYYSRNWIGQRKYT